MRKCHRLAGALAAAAPALSFAAGLPDTGQTACYTDSTYTDGLLIERHLFGLRGDGLIADAIGAERPACWRQTSRRTSSC